MNEELEYNNRVWNSDPLNNETIGNREEKEFQNKKRFSQNFQIDFFIPSLTGFDLKFNWKIKINKLDASILSFWQKTLIILANLWWLKA